MSQFRLTPDAKKSLESIATYTEKAWGKQQRNRYIKQLDDCFHLLTRNPKQGRFRPAISDDLYSFPVGKHVVFYMPKATFVVIVNILHERMDYEQHLTQ